MSRGVIEYLDTGIALGFGQLLKIYELITFPGSLVAEDLLNMRFQKIEDAVNTGGSSGFEG